MSDQKMKALAHAIGKAIAQQRAACELTQEDVAEQLGIGNEAVSRIERGIVMPTVGRLAEFAQIFNCAIADFVLPISPLPSDQVQYLSKLLQDLQDADRKIIVEIVETLVQRFGQKLPGSIQ